MPSDPSRAERAAIGWLTAWRDGHWIAMAGCCQPSWLLSSDAPAAILEGFFGDTMLVGAAHVQTRPVLFKTFALRMVTRVEFRLWYAGHGVMIHDHEALDVHHETMSGEPSSHAGVWGVNPESIVA